MKPKFEFTIKVIEKQLIIERKQLSMWEYVLTKNDINHSHRQANGNIPNTKNRIIELENALAYLKNEGDISV